MAEKIPLVLLPGLLCDAALWAPQVAALSDIAAPWVADLSPDDSLAAMARRVLSVAPARFALAGLSMGGYLAQEIMRQSRQRVTRLALLDTSARADTPERAAQRRGFIELAQKGQFKGITPRMLPVYLHPDHLRDATITGTVLAMAEMEIRSEEHTLNSSHTVISYAVFCLKQKNTIHSERDPSI